MAEGGNAENKMAISPATIPTTFAIEPFDPTVTKWSRWLERMEGAFKISQITEGNKLTFLLHYLGPTIYDVLADRLTPESPYSKTYAEITKKLQEFYEPKPLAAAENYKLMQRKQQEGESVRDFLAALQKLSLNCKLGQHADTMIQNCFICGLRNKRIQNRLLEIEDLNLERTIQIATTMELSEKSTKQLRGEEAIAAVGSATRKAAYCKDKSLQTKKFERGKFSKHGANNERAERRETKRGSHVIICFRCGKDHYASACTMDRSIKCLKCGKAGHVKKVCKAKSFSANTINYGNTSNEIFTIQEHTQYRNKFHVTLNVNKTEVRFEIDSGAAVTLMSKHDADQLFPRERILKTDVRLTSFCKTRIQVLGYIPVKVRSGETVRKLNLYITTENREPLLGREWILQMKENPKINFFLEEVQSIHTVQNSEKSQLQGLLQEFKEITNPTISKILKIQARLKLKDNVSPIFCKPRGVPFRLRAQVEKELDKLTSMGILEKVDHSDWATPIVPILKKNGAIRLCGDYSVTINPNLRIDEHPLPTPDELLTQMAGGTVFSKIDLLQAYLQLEMRQEDRELLTINTHKGLYRPTRLMYGVASAPAIWQRTIENILKDIPGVVVFLDDIRISGSDAKDHLQKLRTVFTRLQKYNIRINKEKSEFFTEQIQYCGYIINKSGIHKAPDKVEAINNMRRPTNITELRSFLGMIHYYDRFIPNLSSILKPLNTLLQKETKYEWSSNCEKSFQAAKEAFTSPRCLVHFDPKLPIALATDASPYGVGAVLSHIFPDGSERAIQYASRTLSKTQQAYAQIDKEAFAIIFGVKKFYQYLQGAKFTLITDHRPLTQIFSPTKSLPVFTASRMQHYALFLQSFNYDIQYRKSELHANADCLSRLPIPATDTYECDTVDEFHNATFNTLPVTAEQVGQATLQDDELSKLLKHIRTGQGYCKNNKFHSVPITEFTLSNDVIFREHKVVIPAKLQPKILQELHSGHFGVVRMKHLARSYVWWNKIDNDIENLVKNCFECNAYRNNPVKITNHIWEPASIPFERVHADFAGPFLGHYFFILVDSFTKWPEIHVVKNINSVTTIEICRKIFATYGLPQYFVSDNGKAFISKEFTDFLKVNGITQKLTAPYHPATNGQAERYVQTLKNSLKRMRTTYANVQSALQQLLMQYRNTPHAKTGVSPAETLFSRKLRTRLDLLRPVISKEREHTPPFIFEEGKRVSCRNYTGNVKWIFGKILKQLGDLHYEILLDDGRVWKRHVNQVRPIGENTPVKSDDYIQFEDDVPPNIMTENTGNRITNNVSPNTTNSETIVNTPSNVTIRENVNTNASIRVKSKVSTPPPSNPEITLENSQYSTPTGSFLTSTPRPSPEQIIQSTPTAMSTHPRRKIVMPKRFNDYVLPK